MSRHLHFDLVGGIAGDMTVAALVDAGASAEELRARLAASRLPLPELTLERQWKDGMAGLQLRVAPERDPPTRTWSVVRVMLEEAALPDRPKQLALAMFGALAQAEAAVHGCSLEDVHFHEVGAMDSIVDFVATAVAVDMLGAASFSCGSVPVCLGEVRVEHGSMPLPAPAAAWLLRGFTLVPIEGAVETVTPTGAAILSVLCRRSLPSLRLLAVGTGLGSSTLPGRPNVLRVLLGELSPERRGRADAVVIEASIDDMDPRLYGSVQERLFAAGALDVTLSSLQMKKQRPGTLLAVLARPELEGLLTEILLRETTTLGVRSHDVRRFELDRRSETVSTPHGPVRVKLGMAGGRCLNVSPEYEDCAELARASGVPIKKVLAAAVAAASAQWNGEHP